MNTCTNENTTSEIYKKGSAPAQMMHEEQLEIFDLPKKNPNRLGLFSEIKEFCLITGEQFKIAFSWSAKILLDMKKIIIMAKSRMQQWNTQCSYKESIKREFKWYREWKAEFLKNGNISECPDFVYFQD